MTLHVVWYENLGNWVHPRGDPYMYNFRDGLEIISTNFWNQSWQGISVSHLSSCCLTCSYLSLTSLTSMSSPKSTLKLYFPAFLENYSVPVIYSLHAALFYNSKIQISTSNQPASILYSVIKLPTTISVPQDVNTRLLQKNRRISDKRLNKNFDNSIS